MKKTKTQDLTMHVKVILTDLPRDASEIEGSGSYKFDLKEVSRAA